jgi:hypothetical protein
MENLFAWSLKCWLRKLLVPVFSKNIFLLMSTNPWVTGPIVLLTNDTFGTNETERSINHNCVDNHACILLSVKNTLGIQMKVTTESDRRPEAPAGQNQRTVSCPQDRLRTGTGDSPFLRRSTTLSTTPASNSVYNSNLQIWYTTPHYRAYYRLPRKIRLPRLLLLLPPLPRSSSPWEPRTSRSIVSRIINIV